MMLRRDIKKNMNTAYNRDCLTAMKEYPDKYFDLAVVDPPYGIGIEKMDFTSGKQHTGGRSLTNRRNYKHKPWDVKPEKQYFDELMRVSKEQIIWGVIILRTFYLFQRALFVGTKEA